MPRPNTIGTTEALMRDGSVISYRDTDPSHIRQERLRHILDSGPLTFTIVDPDGSSFTVDLRSGALIAADQRFDLQELPATPLRLIYYKHMEAWTGGHAELMYYVVGWQTTVEGKNRRLGLKVDPHAKSFEVTEEI